jgi:hypothetical protein
MEIDLWLFIDVMSATCSYTSTALIHILRLLGAKGISSSVGCLQNLYQLLWLCKYFWGISIDFLFV